MLKSRLTFLYFGAAITAGIFVACSGNANDKAQTPEIVVEEGEDATPREKGNFDLPKTPYSKTIVAAYKKLGKAGKQVEFFTKNKAGIFFLNVNQEPVPMWERKEQKKDLLFGLLNEKGKQLLPVEYQKIGNPGMIAENYMELKKNGKYGLYDYVRDTVIRSGYDVLYPSPVMAYIAIGQRKGKLYRIYENGTEKPLESTGIPVDYQALIKECNLEKPNKHFGYWIETKPMDSEDGSYDLTFGGTALVQLPSFIDNIGIMPPTVMYLNMPWTDLGSLYMNSKVENSMTSAEGVTTVITSLFETIGEARPDEIDHRYLFTLDKNNFVKAKTKLLHWNQYALMDYTSENEKDDDYDEMIENAIRAKFLNDSVVETVDFAQYEGDAIPYSNYTKYNYITVHKDGTISPKINGLFPMTSSMVLKPEHFKGCFVRRLREDEVHTEAIPEEYLEYGGEYYNSITYHLSEADLEYMEMEIYGRYGLKFSDVKWKGVFANQSWYKNKNISFEKVQSMLTPTEKKNIALMRKIRKQLKADPNAYLKEKVRPHFAAG